MIDLFDICEAKHGGADTSRIAPHKAVARMDILEAISDAEHGLTLDELAAKFDTAPHKISGRITELRKLDAIYVAGTKLNAGGNKVRIYKASR